MSYAPVIQTGIEHIYPPIKSEITGRQISIMNKAKRARIFISRYSETESIFCDLISVFRHMLHGPDSRTESDSYKRPRVTDKAHGTAVKRPIFHSWRRVIGMFATRSDLSLTMRHVGIVHRPWKWLRKEYFNCRNKTLARDAANDYSGEKGSGLRAAAKNIIRGLDQIFSLISS